MIQKVSVLWASETDLPMGWPLLGHTHSFYHLFYTRSGKGTFLLDHRPYEVSKGDCLIIPPGVLHEIPAEGHTLMDTFEIKFTINDSNIESTLREMGPLLQGDQAYIEKTIQYIVFNWMRNDPVYLDNIDSFLSSLLLSVRLDQYMSGCCTSSYIDTAPYNDLTRRVISYIEKNHTEPFRLGTMAADIGHNERYLCSVFKNNTGFTIIDYLNHIRIRHASSLFHYVNVPISLICQDVGFTNPIHFTRVFKDLVGVSPSQFRKLYSLDVADMSEKDRIANPYPALYDEIIGVKILPLEDSIAGLRRLGRIACEATAGHAGSREEL